MGFVHSVHFFVTFWESTGSISWNLVIFLYFLLHSPFLYIVLFSNCFTQAFSILEKCLVLNFARATCVFFTFSSCFVGTPCFDTFYKVATKISHLLSYEWNENIFNFQQVPTDVPRHLQEAKLVLTAEDTNTRLANEGEGGVRRNGGGPLQWPYWTYEYKREKLPQNKKKGRYIPSILSQLFWLPWIYLLFLYSF